LHKIYAETVVSMVPEGWLSADEAMRMNPTGGIVGPDLNRLANVPAEQIKDDGSRAGADKLMSALGRHGVIHDAGGFLGRLGVGPGYGGTAPDTKESGQLIGILHEFVDPSTLPG